MPFSQEQARAGFTSGNNLSHISSDVLLSNIDAARPDRPLSLVLRRELALRTLIGLALEPADALPTHDQVREAYARQSPTGNVSIEEGAVALLTLRDIASIRDAASPEERKVRILAAQTNVADNLHLAEAALGQLEARVSINKL